MKENHSVQVIGLAVLSASLGLLAGCQSMGPRTIPADRSNYSAALADSWKHQMLLNIVKTRYLDLPIYLDVGQIVSGYTFEKSGTVGFGGSELGGANGSLGGTFRIADSPTITYTPLTGQKFLEAFLAPIEPVRIFLLLESGYAADFILEMGLNSLNGLRNRSVKPGSTQVPDPDFFRVLKLLGEIQESGSLGVRVDRPVNGEQPTVVFLRSEKVPPEVQDRIQELRDLLHLEPGASSFRIVSSPVRGGAGELAVGTRSLMQMMGALSLTVEVPVEHQKRKLAPPFAGSVPEHDPILRIHSGPDKPEGALVAVCYEGQWFWINNDDWKSKRTFSSILFLFTLANNGSPQNLPALTIPTR